MLSIRQEQVLTLSVSALLAGLLSTLPLSMIAEGLGTMVGHRLCPARPGLAMVVVIILGACVLELCLRVRRLRKASEASTKRVVAESTGAKADATKSTVLSRRIENTALLETVTGIFAASLAIYQLLTDPGLYLETMFGETITTSHTLAIHSAVVGILVLSALWLFWSGHHRNSESQLARAPADDQFLVRAHGAFSAYLRILGIAMLLGVALALVYKTTEVWLEFLPWTALASAFAVVLAFADTTRTFFRAQLAPEALLKEAALSQLVVQAICLLLILVVVLNVEGMAATADVYSRVSPAMRIGFFAMPALFLGFVLAMLLRFAYSGLRVRAFISFHHASESTAAALEETLRGAGLRARRIPFLADYQHDQLIWNIADEIRRCDVMVCLPGTQPTFVEAEVLAALTLRKFIIFLVGEKEPRLPNTAYYGYPAFRLESVAERNYQQVSELILLVAGNWRASIRFLFDSWSRLFSDARSLGWVIIVFVAGSYLTGAAYALLTGGVPELLRFLRWFHRAYLDLLGDWLLFWLWINGFLIGSVFTLLNLLRVRRVLRQEILTGHLTHDVLRAWLGNGKRVRRLLDSLWKRPPPPEHEVQGP